MKKRLILTVLLSGLLLSGCTSKQGKTEELQPLESQVASSMDLDSIDEITSSEVVIPDKQTKKSWEGRTIYVATVSNSLVHPDWIPEDSIEFLNATPEYNTYCTAIRMLVTPSLEDTTERYIPRVYKRDTGEIVESKIYGKSFSDSSDDSNPYLWYTVLIPGEVDYAGQVFDYDFGQYDSEGNYIPMTDRMPVSINIKDYKVVDSGCIKPGDLVAGNTSGSYHVFIGCAPYEGEFNDTLSPREGYQLFGIYYLSLNNEEFYEASNNSALWRWNTEDITICNGSKNSIEDFSRTYWYVKGNTREEAEQLLMNSKYSEGGQGDVWFTPTFFLSGDID